LKHFGLIGHTLTHSFSQAYFTQKFEKEGIEATYSNFPLADLDELVGVLRDNNLSGFNVTIPFKEKILSKLDWISPEAKTIGAVNCVRVDKGKLYGYNTDFIGFEQSLHEFYAGHGPALVFGNGGASKAIIFVLKQRGIPYQIVSRNEILDGITYADLNRECLESHPLLINTTPVGSYPDVEAYLPLTYKYVNSTHFAYDLVYNPPKTKFLEFCEAEGANIKNGHDMLVIQAEESFKLW
jgi:shikimate dehydrogenase